jgi:hypothetical protein
LSIIMVGQKVAAVASDKQAFQTYKDAEALLEISNDLHKLLIGDSGHSDSRCDPLRPHSASGRL